MRKNLFTIAVAFALVLGLSSLVAFAADIRLGALASTDAGTTNSLTVPAKITVSIQCKNPSCYVTGTSTLTSSCSTDYILPLVGSRYERILDTGPHTKIAAYAGDAGNPDCQVYQVTKNPTLSY